MLELRSDFRSFIEQYSIGHRSTAELVSRGIEEIRKHLSSISAETTKSLGEVQERLDVLVLAATAQGSQAKRDRLLGSLKFAGLNERRSQVSEAYENTGNWIFAGDGDGIEVVNHAASSIPVGASSATNKLEEGALNLQNNVSNRKRDSFSKWLRSSDTLYWISGKPGSGKTTLVNFIVQHPHTEALLNVCRPKSLVISHFFWRPGTLLQRSIKGMLCSVLYQLFQNSSTVLDSALASVPNLKTKDADTDWSFGELRVQCLQAISTYQRPICLFLDGLDEVETRDRVERLLDLVQELSQSRNIKICLSSRSEPLLQKRLSEYPQLRLQDLNRKDLESYARDHVRLPDGTSMDRGSYNTIHSLVDKSEGVFLWLVLAINSINKGVDYGDTLHLVNDRIDQLPGDLVDMYEDMWQRTCADNPTKYRQTAALYFKLILTHRGNRPARYERFLEHLDLFTFVLASTSLADEILEYGDETPRKISEGMIIQRCREVERQIDVYCFGLVELLPNRKDDGDRIKTIGLYGDKYDRILPSTSGNKLLQFIHRTAHDFLLDTEEGRAILDLDMSSNMSLEIRIIKAYMASSQLFLRGERYVHPGLMFAGVPLYLLRDLHLTYQETNDWLKEDWRQLFQYCEVLCNTGKLVAGSVERARLCEADDFLNVAANVCGHECVSFAVKKTLNKDIRSEILLNACSLSLFADHIGNYGLESRDYTDEEAVRMLLCDGADPNWKGSLFSPDLWVGPFAQLETAFTRYLASTIMLTKPSQPSPYDVFAFLKTLDIFIDREAHLNQTVPMLFRIENSDRPGREGSYWTLEPIEMRGLHQVDDWPATINGRTFLIVSFAVYDILDTLFYIMRQKVRAPGGAAKFSELCSPIQARCESRRGSKRSRLICRIAAVSGKGGWFETAEDQQERIASEVLRYLRNSLTSVSSATTQNDESFKPLLSLYSQGPWSLKLSGKHEIWEQLERLRILTKVDENIEVRTRKEWAEKHRSRYIERNDNSASRH